MGGAAVHQGPDPFRHFVSTIEQRLLSPLRKSLDSRGVDWCAWMERTVNEVWPTQNGYPFTLFLMWQDPNRREYVYYWNKNWPELECLSAYRQSHDEKQLKPVRIPWGQGVIWDTVLKRQSQCIPDLFARPEVVFQREDRKQGNRSIIMAAVGLEQEFPAEWVVGVYSPVKGIFTEEALAKLEYAVGSGTDSFLALTRQAAEKCIEDLGNTRVPLSDADLTFELVSMTQFTGAAAAIWRNGELTSFQINPAPFRHCIALTLGSEQFQSLLRSKEGLAIGAEWHPLTDVFSTVTCSTVPIGDCGSVLIRHTDKFEPPASFSYVQDFDSEFELRVQKYCCGYPDQDLESTNRWLTDLLREAEVHSVSIIRVFGDDSRDLPSYPPFSDSDVASDTEHPLLPEARVIFHAEAYVGTSGPKIWAKNLLQMTGLDRHQTLANQLHQLEKGLGFGDVNPIRLFPNWPPDSDKPMYAISIDHGPTTVQALFFNSYNLADLKHPEWKRVVHIGNSVRQWVDVASRANFHPDRHIAKALEFYATPEIKNFDKHYWEHEWFKNGSATPRKAVKEAITEWLHFGDWTWDEAKALLLCDPDGSDQYSAEQFEEQTKKLWKWTGSDAPLHRSDDRRITIRTLRRAFESLGLKLDCSLEEAETILLPVSPGLPFLVAVCSFVHFVNDDLDSIPEISDEQKEAIRARMSHLRLARSTGGDHHSYVLTIGELVEPFGLASRFFGYIAQATPKANDSSPDHGGSRSVSRALLGLARCRSYFPGNIPSNNPPAMLSPFLKGLPFPAVAIEFAPRSVNLIWTEANHETTKAVGARRVYNLVGPNLENVRAAGLDLGYSESSPKSCITVCHGSEWDALLKRSSAGDVLLRVSTAPTFLHHAPHREKNGATVLHLAVPLHEFGVEEWTFVLDNLDKPGTVEDLLQNRARPRLQRYFSRDALPSTLIGLSILCQMYLCVCSEGNQTPALLEDTLLYEEPQRARLRARFGKSVGWRKVLGQGNLLRDAKMEWGISDENWSSVAELIRAMSRGKREIRPDVVTKALSAMESRIRAKTNASGTSEGAIVSLRTADDDEAPHRCWNAVFALGRSKAAIAISQILAALAGCKSGILSISSASTLPEGHRNALLVITPPLTRQMQSLRKLRAKKFAGPILILADEILGDLQTQFSILRFGEGTQSVILPGFNLTELWCIATRLTPLMPTNLLRCNQELRETKRVLELKVSEHINRLSLCKTREEFANKLDGVIELVNTRTIASHTPVEIGNTRLPIKKHLYNAIDAVRSNDIDPAAIFPTIQLLLERWKDSAPE